MEEPFEEIYKDPKAAKEMAINYVLSFLKRCEIKDPKEKRDWINDLCSRLLQASETKH